MRRQLRMIQTGLARYGLYNGAIDGDFGKGTRPSKSLWTAKKKIKQSLMMAIFIS